MCPTVATTMCITWLTLNLMLDSDTALLLPPLLTFLTCSMGHQARHHFISTIYIFLYSFDSV